MRYLLTFLLAIALVCPAIGQVAGAEYFVDTDPGYGVATPISTATGDDISKDFTLALASVAQGFHIIGVRAKDAQGHWSHTYVHSFYVIAENATNITANEYYIDTDPGYGNATNITIAVGADSTLNYVVPLSAYNTGFHTVGIRSKDNQGRWSQTTLHTFYINEAGAPVNITSLQYYFTGTGATDSIYTYTIPTPAPSVDLNFTADLSQLVGEREYNMHVWAVNANGVRSQAIIKKVKVCSGEPAKARFDFIPLGTQVTFIDSSKGATRYRWSFGDGTIDSVSNPVHTYATGGAYNVRLVASNFCNSDTVVKDVRVLGLQGISPKTGGNTGTVSVVISGGGFNSLTKVRLVKSGAEIQGVNNSTSDNGKFLYTTFNLTNQQIGTWDLKVINGIDSLTLSSAFSIEIGIQPIIKIDIVGRTTFRAGRAEKFTIKYTNLGNVDTYLVPISLLYPKTVHVQLINELIKLSGNYNLPVFNEDSLGQTIDKGDSTLLALLIPHIPAMTSGEIEILLNAPASLNIPFTVLVNRPVYESINISSQNRSLENTGFSECWATHIGAGLVVAGVITGEFSAVACVGAITTSIAGMAVSMTDLLKENEKRLRDNDKTSPLISVLTFTASAAGLIIVSPFVCTEATFAAGVGYGFAGLGVLISAADYNNNRGCLNDVIPYRSILNSITSYDPNEKVGPTGNTIANYNQGSSPFNYKIYFENKNTATAPAQEVIIVDTLDKIKFDLTTFQLKSFGFGDSVNAYIPAGLPFYATDRLLHRPGKPDLLVRIDAKLDTATGILKWRFLSLDPLTREFITDPLDGFLPPNVTSPKGEGYISYSITPKADLPHGTVIKNKAAIYFDNNAPIVTNEFINTIDKVKPVSAVASIPTEVYDTTFTVQWSGTDNEAGIRSYDVYYKVNNGPYQLWQYDVSLAANDFPGQKDSTYSFFSISKDYAGNIETSKTTAERVVTVRMYDSSNTACASAITKFQATPAGAGFTYHWQVNQGTGFVDISNNAIYSGTATTELMLTAPPTAYTNYQYRCKITNDTVTYYSSKHAVRFTNTWLGTTSTAWEMPANWSCGIVPDENTHVIVPAGVPHTPVVNANGACKSLTMNSASNILIKNGVNLIITGKLNN